MISQLDTTVAFTGHRTYRGGEQELLLECIRSLYARGMRTFLTGMAVGFDLAAGECVAACRADCPGMRLVAVVPFAGQECRFPAAGRARFERLVAAADEVVILSDHFYTGCYAVRNDFLTDHASLVVAWHDGRRRGGTWYTVRRALARGRALWNLHPSHRMTIRPAQQCLDL